MSVRVSVLGSGSKGNCTLLATEKTRLLIDAGLSCRETYARLAAVGERADGLSAVVISHEHTDHISGLRMLALDANTYVSGHGPTITKLELQDRLARWEDKINKVNALVAQGKTLPEIQEALGEPVTGGRGPGLGTFTANIYLELTRKPSAAN